MNITKKTGRLIAIGFGAAWMIVEAQALSQADSPVKASDENASKTPDENPSKIPIIQDDVRSPAKAQPSVFSLKDILGEGDSNKGTDAQAGTPACAGGALFGQSPHGPFDNWLAGTSEEGTGFRRWANFAAVGGSIETVTWWGVDLVFRNNAWFECDEIDPTFTLTFHEDAGGFVGEEVHRYTVTATRAPTGLFYNGTELNEYRVTLPTPCVLTRGWLSILGQGDENCWFLWLTSPEGDRRSYCQGCRPEGESFDLSFCLEGPSGGVFGACCDEKRVRCEEAVEINECLANSERLLLDGGCDDFMPECGVILGACCLDDATCSQRTRDDCNGQGGLWLGAHTPCDQCPCRTPCPPGAVPEGEPTCRDFYVDEFNGGCDVETVRFSPIRFGRTVCGEGGVFFDSGDGDRDLDWYELRVRRATTVVFSVEAEFPIGAWLVDGTNGCENAVVLRSSVGYECDRVTVSAPVDPGVYWLVTGAVNFDDLSYCGAPYVAKVFRKPIHDAPDTRVGPIHVNPLPPP